MKENSIYDKKSLRTVVGKSPDFNELAKDCVAFSNAEGGCIDIGIEDDQTLPPEEQKIPDGLATEIVNKINGKILNNRVASTISIFHKIASKTDFGK